MNKVKTPKVAIFTIKVYKYSSNMNYSFRTDRTKPQNFVFALNLRCTKLQLRATGASERWNNWWDIKWAEIPYEINLNIKPG